MGVDFYVCRRCGESYADCGPCENCDEDHGGCGAGFCSAACAELRRPGHDLVPTWAEIDAMPREEFEALKITCFDCRGENANDANLLAFMLRRSGLSREQATAEYLAQCTDSDQTTKEKR